MSVDFFANNSFAPIGCHSLNQIPVQFPGLAPSLSTTTELESVNLLPSSSSSANTVFTEEITIPVSDRPLPLVNNPTSLVNTLPSGSGGADPITSVVTEKIGTNPLAIVQPLPEVINVQRPLPVPALNPLVVNRAGPSLTAAGVTTSAANPSSLVTISNLSFSGKEGDSGTFQVRLNLSQAPTSNIEMSFTSGSFLVVDADGTVSNGTQSSITFTPQNWNQARTVWFIAEKDSVSTNRTTGNAINYALSGGTTFSGTYDLGIITNTYAPDLTRFNIDLDFRNDTNGFWTAQRRAIAQTAANDWANLIANEFTGFQLNNSIKILENGSYSNNTFLSRAYVDDLLVFVNSMNSGGTAGGYGGPEYTFGGWSSTSTFPRVAQLAIDIGVSDSYLYNAVLHELGHTLGLVGMNLTSYFLQDLSSPQTAVFKGTYSTAANGGNYIPLQSQDGPNPVTGAYDYWHPAQRINSVMSYGSIYTVSGPTAIDKALLADSGYLVRGVNAPLQSSVVARPVVSSVASRPAIATAAAASAPPPPPTLQPCTCFVCQEILRLSRIGESNLSDLIAS